MYKEKKNISLHFSTSDKGILEEKIVYARHIKHGKSVTNLVKVQSPNSVDAAGKQWSQTRGWA